MTSPDLFQLFRVEVDQSFCGVSDKKEVEAFCRVINDVVGWLSFQRYLEDTGMQ